MGPVPSDSSRFADMVTTGGDNRYRKCAGSIIAISQPLPPNDITNQIPQDESSISGQLRFKPQASPLHRHRAIRLTDSSPSPPAVPHSQTPVRPHPPCPTHRLHSVPIRRAPLTDSSPTPPAVPHSQTGVHARVVVQRVLLVVAEHLEHKWLRLQVLDKRPAHRYRDLRDTADTGQRVSQHVRPLASSCYCSV